MFVNVPRWAFAEIVTVQPLGSTRTGTKVRPSAFRHLLVIVSSYPPCYRASMTTNRSGSAKAIAKGAVTAQGRVISTPRASMVIMESGTKRVRSAPHDQTAAALLPRFVKAISTPGLNRDAIFKGRSNKGVYAYSLDPKNPDLLIREDASGKKTTGKLVGAQQTFRPLRKAA